MIKFRLDWIVLMLMGVCIGGLLCYRPKANLDVYRLCNRLDHSLDIVGELKELAQNIAIKDATDYFDSGVEGCGKQLLLPSDIVTVGTILDTKSKQIYQIVHQVLYELRRVS